MRKSKKKISRPKALLPQIDPPIEPSPEQLEKQRLEMKMARLKEEEFDANLRVAIGLICITVIIEIILVCH